MRIFIVRHLDESFFSAEITPQGFYDQHSPLTLFRKVEVWTIIYHANSSFQLDAFVEYWVVIEIGSLERSALPDKLSS